MSRRASDFFSIKWIGESVEVSETVMFKKYGSLGDASSISRRIHHLTFRPLRFIIFDKKRAPF